MKNFLLLAIATLTLSAQVYGVDRPGGLVSTATSIPKNTYEVILSPAYAVSPGGAYLSSELRMMPWDDVGLAFGFGAGELGFNIGGNGTWFVSPDVAGGQPAFAVQGGLYFNRVASLNYFVLQVTPKTSKTFQTSWAKITPYAGLPLGPSFALGGAATNQFTMKASTGVEFAMKDWGGLHVWTEFGFGILHSVHELVLGVSFPFTALAG